MKSAKRLLLGIGIAIAALAVIAVVLVFTQKDVTLLPQDTPQGTVQRFLIAVQNKDYPQAYSYLQITERDVKGLDGKVSYDDWVRFDVPLMSSTSQPAWKATLGQTTISGSNASVEVFVDTFRPNSNGPFGSSTYTQLILFQLTKTGNSWLINTRPPLYWLY